MKNEREEYKPGPKNYLSIATYFLIAVFGGFWPVVAYILVMLITCWWIVPEKRRKKE